MFLGVNIVDARAIKGICKDINVEALKNEEHIVAMTPDWILY
jgi:hypothetical protein